MTAHAGYNRTFFYPQGGLERLCKAMAQESRVYCNRRAVAVDCEKKKSRLRTAAVSAMILLFPLYR